MDSFFGKRKPDGEVEKMSKEELYGGDEAKPKFLEAKAMMGVMHEGKLIQKGEPGFDEALKAASERAKTVEENSVEIDPEYAEDARSEERRERFRAEAAEAGPAAESPNKAMAFSPEMKAGADKIIEAAIRKGELSIEEALRDLDLERSVAGEDGAEALDAKEDLLISARELFRTQDTEDAPGIRANDIVEALKAIARKDQDLPGHADAAIAINRAIEAMSKF